MGLSKLTLNIGLVSIPVEIENAIDGGTKPSGKHVCAESQKPFLSFGTGGGTKRCGEKHSEPCRQTIGYPKTDGSFYVPGDDDLQRLNAEKDKLIKLDTFVPAEEIDPVYFEKTYVVRPAKGSEQAFWLIAERLGALNRVAVGSATFDRDEKLLFLRWSKHFDCVFLSVGIYDEQIKRELISASRLTRLDGGFTREMTRMADDLMKKVFIKPFEPTSYVPTRWHGLRDLIVANGASPNGLPAADSPEPTVDLMAQLKASVAEVAKSTAKAKTSTKSTKRPRKKVA